MPDDKPPAWGSPAFRKAVEEHDAKADPEREKKGLKYTKTRNPANEKKDAGKGNGKKGKK